MNPEMTDLDQAVIALGRASHPPERIAVVSSPVLAALKAAGTEHVYADTADTDELGPVVAGPGDTIVAEVDGNTVNQPLVRRVVDRYVAGSRMRQCVAELHQRPAVGGHDVAMYAYTVLCGLIGHDLLARFAGSRRWEVSLQLHMGAVETAAGLATQLGRCLARMVPGCLVKVPFKPQAPHCFLIARDLEREGIPVNFTSTFSARQAVAAALLTDASRTNVFLGRLNQGLQAQLLGEHVTLEAQRSLRELRARGRTKTLLIAASMRDWRTFLQLAGCDAFTAPPGVLAGFLGQVEVPASEIVSRLETSVADRLGVAETVQQALGPERLRRLWHVEPEFVDFLLEYGASAEYRDLLDGEALAHRFEAAGFGDFFHVPNSDELAVFWRSKLPDVDAPVTRRLALDTHYSLLADTDFNKEQAAIDAAVMGGRAAAA
jgi:transaldolase